MGFGSYIGGILLCIFSFLLALFAVAFMLGFVQLVTASLVIPLGVVLLIIALVLFLYGWYLYKSASPRGTITVRKE